MYPMYPMNQEYLNSNGNCYCPCPQSGAMISKCPYKEGSKSGNSVTIEVAPTNDDFSKACGKIGFSESESRASQDFQVPKTGLYEISSVSPLEGLAGNPISFDIYHNIGLGQRDNWIGRYSIYNQSNICFRENKWYDPTSWYNYYIGTPSNAEGNFYVTFSLVSANEKCNHNY